MIPIKTLIEIGEINIKHFDAESVMSLLEVLLRARHCRWVLL